MKEIKINPEDFPEPIKSMIKNIDIKALENLRNSIDKDKLNKYVDDTLEKLKTSLSEKDHQALTQLIETIKKMKKENKL